MARNNTNTIAESEALARIKRAQDLMDKATKVFREKYNTRYEMTTDSGTVKVYIHWGDWKHDHLFVDYIFTRELGATHYSTDITEDDESDTYSAIHTFIPVGNE